ncbi:MAG: Fpg/Nei family DNA glycosylase [Chitinophagaceae bacterium]|nr:Fpg/Nei family DNA glycosylase [Chitinophagaceae bacterium]
MPELPDLEVFSRNLTAKLKGAVLRTVVLNKAAKANSPAKSFQQLRGQKLKKVYREGKELRFAFTKDILGMHLMLHGKLYWLEDKPAPHTLLQLEFDKGSLGLADFQGQARLSLNPEESDVPDALSPAVNAGFWKNLVNSKATIKNLLLDQKQIRGIGNAYADEILWEARISPFSIANRIPPAAIKKLAAATRKVLNNAIKQVAKRSPDIIGGELRDFLSIHNAKQKLSPAGAPIHQKMAGGRKTYYTDEQEMYGK